MPQTPKMDSYFLTSFELLIRNYFMISIYEEIVFSVYWLLSSKKKAGGWQEAGILLTSSQTSFLKVEYKSLDRG